MVGRLPLDAELVARTPPEVLRLLAQLLDRIEHGTGSQQCHEEASVGEVIAMLSPELHVNLARRVAEGCREAALATLAGGTAVDVAIFDREGALLGRAGV